MSDNRAISTDKPELVRIEEEKVSDPTRALKVELRGLLTSIADPITATALAKAYAREFDCEVDVKRFGYSNLEDFLQASLDSFYIHNSSEAIPRWCAKVLDDKTSALRCLVLNQKKKGEREVNRELLQSVARTGRGHQAAFRVNRDDLDSNSLLPRATPPKSVQEKSDSNVTWKPMSLQTPPVVVPQTAALPSINVERAKRFGVNLSKLGLDGAASSLPIPPNKDNKESKECGREEVRKDDQTSDISSALSSSQIHEPSINPFRALVAASEATQEQKEARVFNYMYPALKTARYLIEQADMEAAKNLLAMLFEDFVQYNGDDDSDHEFGIQLLIGIHKAHFK